MTEQNKPHYKCPIIAAYMAKYFGVRFIDIETGLESYYEGELLYIHPESLPIFEPKDGDGYIANITSISDTPIKQQTAFRNNKPFFWYEV